MRDEIGDGMRSNPYSVLGLPMTVFCFCRVTFNVLEFFTARTPTDALYHAKHKFRLPGRNFVSKPTRPNGAARNDGVFDQPCQWASIAMCVPISFPRLRATAAKTDTAVQVYVYRPLHIYIYMYMYS